MQSCAFQCFNFKAAHNTVARPGLVCSAPKYPAPGQRLFLFEQELLSATCPLTSSFVTETESYFSWIHEA